MQKELICHWTGNWWNKHFGALNLSSIREWWLTRNKVKNRGNQASLLPYIFWVDGSCSVCFALTYVCIWNPKSQQSVKLFLNFSGNLIKEREVWIGGWSCTLLAVLFTVKCLLLSGEKLGRGNPEAEHSQDICLHIPLSIQCVGRCVGKKWRQSFTLITLPFHPTS